MRRRDAPFWIFMLFLLLIVLFGCGIFFQKSQDCAKKDGELVRKLNGTYTCMED